VLIAVVSSQMAGLPNQAPTDVNDVNQLVKLAEDVLDHKSMEFLPFGGRMPLSVSNRERLDWFADQLVKERKARSLRLSPTVVTKSLLRMRSMSAIEAPVTTNSLVRSMSSLTPVTAPGSSRLFALAES
jgi:hypothetical protein